MSPCTPEVFPAYFPHLPHCTPLCTVLATWLPALPPCRNPRRGLSRVSPAILRIPMQLSRNAFLRIPHRRCPFLPSPLRPPPCLLPLPLSLIPLIPSCSYRSTPRSCCCSPPGLLPSRGALSCCRHCLPGPSAASGPVLRAPDLPLSSSLQPSSSSEYPSCCAAALFRPRYSLLLQRLSPLPPLGTCGHLPLPARPFSRPRPPISPIGTKMLAIGRAGLWRSGR